jgi:hypothetical protein
MVGPMRNRIVIEKRDRKLFQYMTKAIGGKIRSNPGVFSSISARDLTAMA